MKTNKNGVKLLAVIMVFAMAFTGTALIAGNVDAGETTDVELGQAMIGLEPKDGVITVGLNADTRYVFEVKGIAATSDTGGAEVKSGTIVVPKETKTIVFNGEGKTTVISTIGQAVTASGLNIEMNNLTYEAGNGNYIGFHHINSEYYNNCWIVGKLQTYAADKLIIEGCVFTQTNSDNYNIQIYGTPINGAEITNCTFNCAGRSFHVYSEGGSEIEVTISGCTFISSSDQYKAAIQVHSQYRHQIVKIEDCTATGFAKGENTGSALWDYRSSSIGGKGDVVPQVIIIETEVNDLSEALNMVPSGTVCMTYDSENKVASYYSNIANAIEKSEIIVIGDFEYDGELALDGIITVMSGITFSASFINTTMVNDEDVENKVVFKNVTTGADGVVISKGSVIITGEFVDVGADGSTITVVSGTAKLVADIPEGMTVTINGDSTLEVPEGISVVSNGTLINEGTLNVEGSLDNEGTVIDKGETIGDIGGKKPAATIDSDGILTLDNYNGNYAFSGDIEQIILIGENTITIENGPSAIFSNEDLKIKSIDGVGSLTIIMNVNDIEDDVIAIEADSIDISGVPVTIVITGTLAEGLEAYGIYVDGSFSIYDSSLSISVCGDCYDSAFGVKASDIDVKSSVIKIDAGCIGMSAVPGDEGISIAASEVTIEASEFGLFTFGTVSVTNISKLTIDVYGLSEENFLRSYAIFADGVVAQTDSIVTIDGMFIFGESSANNAKIINNGDVLIADSAVFINSGSFINNGDIGIYGDFGNAAGELINNGKINSYAYKVDLDNPIAEASIEIIGDDDATLDSINILFISPNVDGTYNVFITVSSSVDEFDDVFIGTMTVGERMSVEASSHSATMTIDFEDGKYTLFVNGTIHSTDEDDVTTSTSLSEIYTISKVGESEDKELLEQLIVFDEVPYITTVGIIGGKVINNNVMSIEVLYINGGELLNTGSIAIANSFIMESGKVTGNDISIEEGVQVIVSGEVDMGFTYTGEFTDGIGTSATKVPFKDVIRITGKVAEVGFIADEKGLITIDVIEESESVGTVSIESGKAQTGDLIVGNNMALVIKEGVTLTIPVTGGVTAEDGVIAVQDGATINMKIAGNKDTFKYGTLLYKISFVNNGYTYYGSLQYALGNAAEGATLNLNGAAEINTNTIVKKGITLVFGEGSVLEVTGTSATKKTTLSMEEGASFVLAKNANVVIEAGETIVSGTVVYDGNAIVLDKVEFITTDATIGAVPATKTDASEISISGTAIAGTVTASTGISSGALELTKSTEGSTLKSVGSLVISEGAVSKIVIDDDEKSIITVTGTLVIEDDTTVDGKITGHGQVLIQDGKTVTFNGKAVADILIGNGIDGFQMSGVSAVKANSSATITGADILKISAIAEAGKDAAYISLEGKIIVGEATAIGNAALGTITIDEKATVIVPEDATLSVISEHVADSKGLLKVAGTLNMKAAGVTSYGELRFEISFEKDGYTIYTGVVNGIAYAEAGDVINIADYTVEAADKELLIPAGVSVVIKNQINVQAGARIVIGSPESTLGATGSIVGKVVLDGNAYVLAYNVAGVDFSSAKIVLADESAAADIEFNVLNNLYATAYIGSTTVKTLSDAVKPVVDGYRFVKWTDVDGEIFEDENATATEDFYAKMAPAQVKVTFTYVDGIIYYVNGVQQNIVGAPVYVDYNAIITAGKLPGYEGTPLVNGETYVTVIGEMTITGSFSKDITYNVTFVNGTSVESIPVKENETVAEPAEPTKDGYTFQYWALNGTEYDFSAPVTQDIVLVAVFEENTPEQKESNNILVSVVSDGTGVKVYLVSLDGGYIAPGKISVKYNYTIVSPEYGPIGLDNTVEEDVTVEDISADGRTAVVKVDLSTKTGYSGITSVMAASGDFTSEKIIYTPVAVL